MSFKRAAIILAAIGASLQPLASPGQQQQLTNTQPPQRTFPRHYASRATPRFLSTNAQARVGSQISVQTRSVQPNGSDLDIWTGKPAGFAPVVPLWSFKINAPRGGIREFGAMVGHDPFRNPGTDRIKTFIVPVVVRTHRVATSYDPSTGAFTTQPGDVTVDPTLPDNNCMAAPNNVPLSVVRQSPIFTPATFVFGEVDVGTTQYLDAFQRASFWQVLGDKADRYHVLLDPIVITSPLLLDVPTNQGLALSDPQLFLNTLGTFCAPVQFIDGIWLDSYLRGTVLPTLARAGIDQTALAVFVFYDSFQSDGVGNLFNCCQVSLHSIAGYPVPLQPIIEATFDRSQFFAGPPSGLDVDPLSREILNWGNDPFFENEVAPYPLASDGCFDGSESGFALTGTSLPPLTMPNGYQYFLGEGAFFSWFYGGASLAVNGWYSDGGTLLSDAGALCH